MTSLKSISPAHAAALVRDGALLIDIREADEHARERIASARHLPLSRLDGQTVANDVGGIVIFHCRSGARTRANAKRLAGTYAGEAYALEGGLQSWKDAGLPVISDRKQPIEIMRQVQIAAGVIVVTGVLLGAFVTPALYGLAGFVGAGLVFAGLTGSCGMAKLLAWMPWNRRTAA
jgi:rhodanese-related sulfurtransferase